MEASPFDMKAVKEALNQPAIDAIRELGYAGFILLGLHDDNTIDILVDNLSEGEVQDLFNDLSTSKDDGIVSDGYDE